MKVRLTVAGAALFAMQTGIVTAAPPREASKSPGAEPPFLIDLTPFLRERLVAGNLADEHAWVEAEKGHQFVTIPFLGRLGANAISFNRTAVRGKGIKACYGFVLPDDQERTTVWAGVPGRIVYERMEPAGSDPGECRLTVRNLSGPRRNEGDKVGGARFKPSTETIPCRGSAAVIVEVAITTKQITLTLAGVEERIDVEALRSATTMLNTLEGDAGSAGQTPPAVAELLEWVAGDSPAMAAFAIARLGQCRPTWPNAQQAAWVTAVDTTMLSSALHDSPLVRSEVWRYFQCAAPPGKPCAYLSDSVLDSLSVAEEELQRRWVDLIGCAFDPASCGMAWLRPTMQPLQPAMSTANGMAILGAILRGDDEAGCRAAAEKLLTISDPSTNWRMLGSVSAVGQQALLDTLGGAGPSRGVRRLLISLLERPHVESADSLAEAAERLQLRLEEAGDRLFAAWADADAEDERLAVLTVMRGVEPGPLIYDERMTGLLPYAAWDDAAGGTKALREAAWNVYLRHVERRHQTFSSASRTQRTGSEAFPLLVDRTANDPVLHALRTAARRGSRALRVRALAALLREGYAAEAALALLDAVTTPSMRDLLVKDLAAQDMASGARDAFVAMLGQLLHRDNLVMAESILSRLATIRATTPNTERWRLEAAIKAGLNFAELDFLTTRLTGAAAEQAKQWLWEITHMTPQDRQRWSATQPPERSKTLDHIDYRRGQIVDGRYGAIAVIETLEPSPPREADGETGSDGNHPALPTTGNWQGPRRRSLTLPPVELTTSDAADPDTTKRFRVTWEGGALGEGLMLNRPRAVGGPARFSPVLQSADWRSVFNGSVRGPSEMVTTIGPLLLQHRAVLAEPAPGTMNLEISHYLREALAAQGLYRKREAERLVPAKLRLTMRYASFGSYYGVCPEPPSTQPEGKPRPRLLNVMLILERMEDGEMQP